MIVSVLKLMDFNSQNASKTPFWEPSPAISHLGWYTYDACFEGGGRKVRQKWDVIGGRGWGVSDYSGRPIWICPMTRHHAEPNVSILLTRNLHFGSDVKRWSHPLMLPLHCLWAKSNNRNRRQLEFDVTWFCLCFVFGNYYWISCRF